MFEEKYKEKCLKIKNSEIGQRRRKNEKKERKICRKAPQITNPLI